MNKNPFVICQSQKFYELWMKDWIRYLTTELYLFKMPDNLFESFHRQVSKIIRRDRAAKTLWTLQSATMSYINIDTSSVKYS